MCAFGKGGVRPQFSPELDVDPEKSHLPWRVPLSRRPSGFLSQKPWTLLPISTSADPGLLPAQGPTKAVLQQAFPFLGAFSKSFPIM